MKEADIVRKMLRILNSYPGVFAFRTHGSAFSTKGIPDIIGCAKGRFFCIEAKRSVKESPSPAQLYIIDLITKSDGKCFVAYNPSIPEVVEWLSTL